MLRHKWNLFQLVMNWSIWNYLFSDVSSEPPYFQHEKIICTVKKHAQDLKTSHPLKLGRTWFKARWRPRQNIKNAFSEFKQEFWKHPRKALNLFCILMISLVDAFSVSCSGVFRPIGPCPFDQKKQFWPQEKIGIHGLFPFCESITGQRKNGPPFMKS